MSKMKKSAMNERLCQGKDVFERMNFLHQASTLVSSQNMALASYYSSILTGCAKKAVLRIDHNIKRTICKVCQSPLIPGKTAKVRLVGKKKKLIKTICCTCKASKRIPTNKKHNLWPEQQQSVLETFDYSLKPKITNVEEDNKNAIDKKCSGALKSNAVKDNVMSNTKQANSANGNKTGKNAMDTS